MSLDRLDVRFKLDHVLHAQLKAICATDGTEINDFVEALVIPVVRKRVHEAIELAERLQRAGIAGHAGEHPGGAGK